MNKFEDKTFEILCDEISMVETMFGPQIEGRSTSANRISTLHDNEMIAFAEWVEQNYTIEDNSNPVRIWGTVFSDQTYTTTELLTIFREENK